MRLQVYTRFARRASQAYQCSSFPSQLPSRSRTFHSSKTTQIVKPYILADIGEGIRECEIIQWFVEPEASVEEWDKLCEVQSDKASVEITSRFSGVVKKLHYEAGEMAQVGKPLMDIDILGEIKKEDMDVLITPTQDKGAEAQMTTVTEPTTEESLSSTGSNPAQGTKDKPREKHTTLATPAIRHLTKELNVNIEDVNGSGKDGRVMKDDVYQFAKQKNDTSAGHGAMGQAYTSTTVIRHGDSVEQETITQLSNIQHQMLKTMTTSLAIPHFLYSDEVDFTALSALRARLNRTIANDPALGNMGIRKLSFLPFLIKAVSLALHQYPILNSRLSIDSHTSKPVLIHRNQHNIGVAMDTPSGLLVPVIKNISSYTILNIAAELHRLQQLASTGKLTTQDLSGGTITVSNIGSIGGTYVSPIIVDREVAILGIGRARTMPGFDAEGRVVPKQVCNFSWCADHRVVDGATMARAAELIKGWVEEPDTLLLRLR